jgi:hypothetical protein
MSALVIGCLTLILFTPAASAGQGGNDNSMPVTLTFTGGGILGDSVPATILRNYGSLSFTEKAQRITFSFNQPVGDVPSLNCYVWGAAANTYAMDMPDGLNSPTSVFIRTYYEYRWVNNQWQEALDSRDRPITLNLLELAGGQTAYVHMVFSLQLATTNDMYSVNFNHAFRAPTGYGGGIFEVTADSANTGGTGDKWYIRPLSTHLPYLGPNEANIRLADMSDFRKDPGGSCTLGNFYMPFEMTITRK